jgi:rifampicin phosphotransferase
MCSWLLNSGRPPAIGLSGWPPVRLRIVQTGRWPVESTPSSRFPLYTRGNVGEVFPNVVSPLTASLFWNTVDQVFIDTYLEFGALSASEVSEGQAPVSGFFSGYVYLNLSAGRLVGVRTPGVSAKDIDAQMYGTYGAPPYQRQPGDRSLKASFSLMRSALKLLKAPPLDGLAEVRRASDAFIASLPDLQTATDAELFAAIDTFQTPYYADFRNLSTKSAVATSGRVMIERALGSKRKGDPSSLANRLTAGVGTIDSAELAIRLWDLGRLVAADASLTAEFERGVPGVVDRLRAVPAGARFITEFDRFIADHGHRCADEYEMAVPSWSTDPGPALAAIERLRLAPEDRSPHLARQRAQADRKAAEREAFTRASFPVRPLLRKGIRVARAGAEARERAKDLFVRDMSAMRLVLAELLGRARDRGGPAALRDGFLVTATELADYVRDPVPFLAIIAERAEIREYLQARVPPFWFDSRVPDPSTWELKPIAATATTTATGKLTGLGVCNGVATGPARVVFDPNDPRGLEPGDVLVVPFTDPAWTPLFLGACAVVVDIGAQMSHAAIIARELGIPAVVSVSGASSTIADGTMLRVDGDRGEVTIL